LGFNTVSGDADLKIYADGFNINPTIFNYLNKHHLCSYAQLILKEVVISATAKI